MKTLDEVIEALHNCADVNANFEACECCGYRHMHDDGYECGRLQMMEDVLHYLKEYRMMMDDIVAMRKKLEAEIDRYQEAVNRCEETENKYRMLKGELEGFPSNMRMNIRW